MRGHAGHREGGMLDLRSNCSFWVDFRILGSVRRKIGVVWVVCVGFFLLIIKILEAFT